MKWTSPFLWRHFPKKSQDKNKKIFQHFKRFSVARNCLRVETGPLRYSFETNILGGLYCNFTVLNYLPFNFLLAQIEMLLCTSQALIFSFVAQDGFYYLIGDILWDNTFNLHAPVAPVSAFWLVQFWTDLYIPHRNFEAKLLLPRTIYLLSLLERIWKFIGYLTSKTVVGNAKSWLT